MLKRIIEELMPNPELEMDPSIHEKCEECGGCGLDFIAGPCYVCDGYGFVEKSIENKEGLTY